MPRYIVTSPLVDRPSYKYNYEPTMLKSLIFLRSSTISGKVLLLLLTLNSLVGTPIISDSLFLSSMKFLRLSKQSSNLLLSPSGNWGLLNLTKKRYF